MTVMVLCGLEQEFYFWSWLRVDNRRPVKRLTLATCENDQEYFKQAEIKSQKSLT